MTDPNPEPVKECDACFAEFTGDGELCPDCESQREQVTNEDGTLMDYETYDPYPGREV